MKAGKRDAERLARLLRDVDALSFATSPEGHVEVSAFAGADRLGVLCRVADAPQVRALRGSGLLALSAGGARRTRLRDQDLLAVYAVALRDDDGASVAPAPGLFQASWRDGVDWQGAPESWPKASTVLLDYASMIGISHLPRGPFEQAIELAATVWTAVVMADESGDRTYLDELRASAAVDPGFASFVESLIDRKRTHFAQDRRLMIVDAVHWTTGRVNLEVSWRMPPAGG